jgi:hypothetical protein
MAGKVVESVVQYEGKQAKEVFKPIILENPALAEQGIKVIADVQGKLYVYNRGKLRFVTKKRTTCGLTATGTGVDITRELITVEDMEIYLTECADIFENTIFETAKKKGVDINDLSGTEIDRLLMEIVLEGTTWDFGRQIWFNDTASADANYSAYSGFLKKIIALVASGDVPNATIGASVDTPAEAYSLLLSVFNQRTLEMKSQPTSAQQFMVTRSIYDLYVQYLSTLNGSEISYQNVINGIEAPLFQGVKVITMPTWDEVLASDTDIADIFPNGIVVMSTDEESLHIAVDAQGDEAKIKTWYSDDDDVQKYLVRYKIGTYIKFNGLLLSVAGFDEAV